MGGEQDEDLGLGVTGGRGRATFDGPLPYGGFVREEADGVWCIRRGIMRREIQDQVADLVQHDETGEFGSEGA